MCTLMFIATLFTTAQICKQPKCPLIDKWIKKQWCTHTVDYYLAVKKSLGICNNMIDPEGIMLGEINQTEEDIYHVISLVCGI